MHELLFKLNVKWFKNRYVSCPILEPFYYNYYKINNDLLKKIMYNIQIKVIFILPYMIHT